VHVIGVNESGSQESIVLFTTVGGVRIQDHPRHDFWIVPRREAYENSEAYYAVCDHIWILSSAIIADFSSFHGNRFNVICVSQLIPSRRHRKSKRTKDFLSVYLAVLPRRNVELQLPPIRLMSLKETFKLFRNVSSEVMRYRQWLRHKYRMF
jgi:hypothetical protein